jgi:hypothetical protein
MKCGVKAGLPSLWGNCFTCATIINGAHLLLLIVKLVLRDVHVIVIVIVLRFL